MAHVLSTGGQQLHAVPQHVVHHVPQVPVVPRRHRHVAQVIEDVVERATLLHAVLEVLERVTDDDLWRREGGRGRLQRGPRGSKRRQR